MQMASRPRDAHRRTRRAWPTHCPGAAVRRAVRGNSGGLIGPCWRCASICDGVVAKAGGGILAR